MLALLLAALGGAGALQDTATRRAESLLAVGNVRPRMRSAERLVAQRPLDARAHPCSSPRPLRPRRVIGRYPALASFRTATRLAPRDPEPLYLQMRSACTSAATKGTFSRGKRSLRIFALDPDYRERVDRFQTLFRSRGICAGRSTPSLITPAIPSPWNGGPHY